MPPVQTNRTNFVGFSPFSFWGCSLWVIWGDLDSCQHRICVVHWKVLNITIRALGGHMSVLGEVLGVCHVHVPFLGCFKYHQEVKMMVIPPVF